MGKTTEEWINILPAVLNTYNATEHSTIGMSPTEAKQKDNKMQVWLNMKNKATLARKYPILNVGDDVRTYIKKTTFSKGYGPRFSEKVYKVISKRGGDYLVNDDKRGVYL